MALLVYHTDIFLISWIKDFEKVRKIFLLETVNK